MILRVAYITLLTLLPAATSSFSHPPGEWIAQQQQPKPDPKNSLTGCVDEKDGRYVLVDDRNLTPIANLVADGFPTEGFAKHMGHKVTVRGTVNSTGTLPVFKVRSVETISESCGANQQ